MVWSGKMELVICKKEKSKQNISFNLSCAVTYIYGRFCNVDYTVLSSVKGEQLDHIVLTFDIGCQYSKKFSQRVGDFPADMQISKNAVIEFAVPSWHINAHGADCCTNFGLSYRTGVGCTCGEEIEGTWAGTNPLGPSTLEMGSGARHETLNGQWGGLNFRRIIGLCKWF